MQNAYLFNFTTILVFLTESTLNTNDFNIIKNVVFFNFRYHIQSILILPEIKVRMDRCAYIVISPRIAPALRRIFIVRCFQTEIRYNTNYKRDTLLRREISLEVICEKSKIFKLWFLQLFSL